MALGISNFERLPWDVKIAFEDAEVQIFAWLHGVPNVEGSRIGNTGLAGLGGAIGATGGAQSEGRHWRSPGPWILDDPASATPDVVGLRPPDPPAGTYNDFAPQGIDDCALIELEPSGNITLTGLKAREGYHKRFILLRNRDSANTITLKHANTGSLVPNRFSLPGGVDYALGPDENVWLYYDPRRKAYTLAGGQGGGSGIKIATLTITEAQMEALNTTPQILIAAVAGKIHIPLHATYRVVVSSAYSNTPTLTLEYSGLATDLVNAATIGFNATDTQKIATGSADLSLGPIRSTTFDPTNKDVVVIASADLTGTGVGSMYVKCLYYSIDSLL